MKFIQATALAIAGVMLASTAALAWHVDIEQDVQTTYKPAAKVLVLGPKADPYYRTVIINPARRFGKCTGSVIIPEERWATNAALTIEGRVTIKGPGASLRLPAGKYNGVWNNREKVQFTITCDAAFKPAVVPVTKFHWRGIGKYGPFHKVVAIPEGMVYKSGWRWLEGGHRTTIKSQGELLAKRWTKTGTFSRGLFRGYDRGLSIL
jgi:hypothetical protein